MQHATCMSCVALRVLQFDCISNFSMNPSMWLRLWMGQICCCIWHSLGCVLHAVNAAACAPYDHNVCYALHVACCAQAVCCIHSLVHCGSSQTVRSIRCASFRRASAVRIQDGVSDVAPWVGSAGAAPAGSLIRAPNTAAGVPRKRDVDRAERNQGEAARVLRARVRTT
jgi:hypothetical protein